MRNVRNNSKKNCSGSVVEKIRSSLARWITHGSDWANAWLRGQEESVAQPINDSYTQSSWVFGCVSAIATKIATVPREAGAEFAALLNKPNRKHTSHEFFELITIHLLTRGRANIYSCDLNYLPHPVRPGRGLPKQLIPLNPSAVVPQIHDSNLSGYRLSATPSQWPPTPPAALPEEIITITLPHPVESWLGLAPTDVAKTQAEAELYSASFLRGLMLNNAKSGLIVSTESGMDETQRQQALAALREHKRRSGNADRDLVLWNGMKLEDPHFSLVNLEYTQGRSFTRQEICSIFKTPEAVLGIIPQDKAQHLDTIRLSWLETAVKPLAEKIAAALNTVVLGVPQQPLSFLFDKLPEYQNARLSRAKTCRTLWEMGVSLEQLNEAFDLGLPTQNGISYVTKTVQTSL